MVYINLQYTPNYIIHPMCIFNLHFQIFDKKRKIFFKSTKKAKVKKGRQKYASFTWCIFVDFFLICFRRVPFFVNFWNFNQTHLFYHFFSFGNFTELKFQKWLQELKSIHKFFFEFRPFLVEFQKFFYYFFLWIMKQ